MMSKDRAAIKKRRFEIVVEMNKLNHLRCKNCKGRFKSSALDCCEAAIKTRELGEEMVRLKGRNVPPIEEEYEERTNTTRKKHKSRKYYAAIAEQNGILYKTFISRIVAGIPEDVAATHTREGLREWRKRHDKQNGARRETH